MLGIRKGECSVAMRNMMMEMTNANGCAKSKQSCGTNNARLELKLKSPWANYCV